MTHYAKTTKELILDWASEQLPGDTTFTSQPVIAWFASRYAMTKAVTVRKHLEGMSANNPAHRKHYSDVRADTNWDHFYKLGPNHYRRFNPAKDPPPGYG